MNYKFTIIVPVYNEEGLLEETLSRLVSSVGSGCQIIVVNTAANDCYVGLATDQRGCAASKANGSKHWGRKSFVPLYIPSSRASQLARLF